MIELVIFKMLFYFINFYNFFKLLFIQFLIIV